ncbi:MAG: response regulator transcription factor [Cyanobacteria bacterium REEB67]|nr:response regulator transcription factor [Cyanobacteria bacterium REEB67]
MAKILLVDDDIVLGDALKEAFTAEKLALEVVTSAEDALQLLRHYQFDVLLFDWNLPGMSGVELCRKYRHNGGLNFIIFLTSEGQIERKEEALDSGGDDYLVKPFDKRELFARIRSALRRSRDRIDEVMTIGDVSLTPTSRLLKVGAKELQLTPRESSILEFLMRNKNRPYSAARLLTSIWPSDSEVSADNVRVLVANLRQKLALAERKDFVKTVHNSGYVVEEIIA